MFGAILHIFLVSIAGLKAWLFGGMKLMDQNSWKLRSSRPEISGLPWKVSSYLLGTLKNLTSQHHVIQTR